MAKSVSATLAANLQLLKEEHRSELGSQPKIAAKAKIGQRTVGRALKGEVSTTIGSLEALAQAFGVAPWQLLHPNLTSVLTAQKHDETEKVRRGPSPIRSTR